MTNVYDKEQDFARKDYLKAYKKYKTCRLGVTEILKENGYGNIQHSTFTLCNKLQVLSHTEIETVCLYAKASTFDENIEDTMSFYLRHEVGFDSETAENFIAFMASLSKDKETFILVLKKIDLMRQKYGYAVDDLWHYFDSNALYEDEDEDANARESTPRKNAEKMMEMLNYVHFDDDNKDEEEEEDENKTKKRKIN